MSEEIKRKGLGRGLSALLGEDGDDYASLDRLRASKEVPVEFLKPNPLQPRRRFDDEATEALVGSIRAHGLLQPILVRRVGERGDSYEIVAGERRWRAAQRAQLHYVPVLIKDLSDFQALEVALVENLQREDLTPLEEAEAYQRLVDQFGHTQGKLAEIIGKSRSHVANMLRLLGLPDTVKEMLQDGRLSAGHARALLGAPDPEALAAEIVARGLSVRDVEDRVQSGKPPRKRAPPAAQDADTLALEQNVSRALGLAVAIRHRRAKGGTVRITYHNFEQLDEVCQRLCHHVA